MKKIFISFAALSFFAACTKSGENLVDNPSSSSNAVMGAYSGEFTKSDVNDTGYLMIDINQLRYDGSSRDPGFPGICGGYYTLSGSTISFDDTCYAGRPIAMLEGTYQYEKNGDSLRMWRQSGGIVELYRMKRIYR